MLCRIFFLIPCFFLSQKILLGSSSHEEPEVTPLKFTDVKRVINEGRELAYEERVRKLHELIPRLSLTEEVREDPYLRLASILLSRFYERIIAEKLQDHLLNEFQEQTFTSDPRKFVENEERKVRFQQGVELALEKLRSTHNSQIITDILWKGRLVRENLFPSHGSDYFSAFLRERVQKGQIFQFLQNDFSSVDFQKMGDLLVHQDEDAEKDLTSLCEYAYSCLQFVIHLSLREKSMKSCLDRLKERLLTYLTPEQVDSLLYNLLKADYRYEKNRIHHNVVKVYFRESEKAYEWFHNYELSVKPFGNNLKVKVRGSQFFSRSVVINEPHCKALQDYLKQAEEKGSVVGLHRGYFKKLLRRTSVFGFPKNMEFHDLFKFNF